DFPWLTSQVTGGEVVRISRLDDLPEAAATDRQSLAGRGLRPLTGLPLLADGALVGALAFSRLRGEYAWPDELTARLRLLADVFANVLARRSADEAGRTSGGRPGAPGGPGGGGEGGGGGAGRRRRRRCDSATSWRTPSASRRWAS